MMKSFKKPRLSSPFLAILILFFIGTPSRAMDVFGFKALPMRASELWQERQRKLADPFTPSDLDALCVAKNANACTWRRVLEVLKASSGAHDRLIKTHSALLLNISYAADIEAHGTEEHFQSAKETIVLGSGDCEDYAILAFWLLENSGLRSEEMSVVLTGDHPPEISHAVLAVQIDGKTQVIDNRAHEVYQAKPGLGMHPAVSFNKTQFWVHARPRKILE